MKQYRNILLAVALVAASAAPALAGVKILPRLTWNRGVSSYGAGVTDSTRISILGPGASVDFADTTEWVDLGTHPIANQAYTGQNLLWFSVHAQGAASSDSIGYVIQYSNDLATDAGGFLSGTLTYVTGSNSGMVPLIPAVAPAATVTTAPLARFYRIVVYNAEVGGTVGRRYFSVRPVILESDK